MSISEYDKLDPEEKRELLQQCCGSSAWVEKMIAQPMFEDLVNLDDTAEDVWYSCTEEDWKEAFAAHPKIGDISSLKKKFNNTAELAAAEQSGVNEAPVDVISKLMKANEEYERKFGFIFIICATGKSAQEMLDALYSRIDNDPIEEIQIAAEEQAAIIKLRLENLFL